MSNTLQYSLEGYINVLVMSTQKRLLVEDSNAQSLFEYFFKAMYRDQETIVSVHNAAYFIRNHQTRSNREKVEQVVRSCAGQPCERRLVGFVCRGVRAFEWDKEIKDTLNAHNVAGRLVWSRGAALENYFFAPAILHEALRIFSLPEYFEDAITVFEDRLDGVLRLACAMSLVGNATNTIEGVVNSIDATILEITSQGVSLVEEQWMQNLMQMGFSSEQTNDLLNHFQDMWDKVQQAHTSPVRWLCDGQIGLALLWAIYERCVHNVCADQQVQASSLLSTHSVSKFNCLAQAWARQVPGNRVEYPAEVLHLLGLSIPVNTDTLSYEAIVGVIYSYGREIERLPSIYQHKGEEALRDLFVAHLGQYCLQGSATGETFNKKGKTDILVRYRSSNIFIAECKFWRGPELYLATLSQLLGYLTWRDAQAAAIIFVQNKSFTEVLRKVETETAKHGSCIALVSREAETWFRYHFRDENDPDRKLAIDVLLFHFP